MPEIGLKRPRVVSSVICITLSADREVHRRPGWASANSTPAEALCGRSCLGRQQLWACPGHNPITIPGLSRRPQTDRDRLRPQQLRQLGRSSPRSAGPRRGRSPLAMISALKDCKGLSFFLAAPSWLSPNSLRLTGGVALKVREHVLVLQHDLIAKPIFGSRRRDKHHTDTGTTKCPEIIEAKSIARKALSFLRKPTCARVSSCSMKL